MGKMRFGIRAKIMIGYLFIIICITISFVLVNRELMIMQKDRNYVIEHDFAISNETNRLEKYVMDMEIGQRGYLLTGESNYLEPYNSAESHWRDAYMRLLELSYGNAVQLNNLASIKSSIENWLIQSGGAAMMQLRKEISNTSAFNVSFFQAHQDILDIRAQLGRFRTMEMGYLTSRTKELDAQNQMLTHSLFAMLGLVLLFSLIAAVLVSGSIVGTLKQVTRSIIKLTSMKRDRSKRIYVRMNDEVKDLAEATNALLENQEEIEWQQRKLTELIRLLQGIPDLEQLAAMIIGQAYDMFGASYGVFYFRSTVNGKDVLMKLASYADVPAGDEVGKPYIAVGEGLVGQSVLEKRMFHLTHVPDAYITLSTGLCAAKAQSVLIVPILHNNEVISIIELASLERFTSMQLELLHDTLEMLGTIIHSVQTRVELEQLLQEYQVITEELRTQQEELHITNEQLEERNRYADERSRELEHMRASFEEYAIQLEQSSRYKSEFLANMSHELRTPLNSVLILSQMLHENGNGSLSKEEQEYARVIHSSGNDLLHLINDILDLSKVEAGKLDIHVGEMNLFTLPDILRSQFDKVAEQRNLDFTIAIDADVPASFYSDEQRVSQIVKNLLSNAFKFTHEGAVQVAIRKCLPDEMDSVVPTVKHSGLAIAISVQDTGIGISPDKQQLIFEPFTQADGTTNRKYGGTGLGLSISRELARLLGGAIVMESEEGRGSRFTLYVPSIQHKMEEMNQASLEAAASSGSTISGYLLRDAYKKASAIEAKNNFADRKVLVVDDDVRNVYALCNAFEKEGIRVSVAQNGQECIELLQQDPDIELILMDIMMPVMDGYEAIRLIRKDERYAEVPIIALTAKAMKQDREICLQAGASDYISKPLNLSQLFSLMRVWLS
ncbi:ATP-binding protein [Paenibacillus oryzisoli]|uniref:ATP-binding protein n=1 Tax=Paenibacillus oryzisoli TaxID=1850517 RepID=UPI003D2ACD92